MTIGTMLSDRPWRCYRCKCPRGYVTVETSLASSIKYEVIICEHCAHVEHRAADLESVAGLAARGVRGVRHVEFPEEVQRLRWNSEPGAPPAAPGAAPQPLTASSSAITPGGVAALDKPVYIPPPPPMPRAKPGWTAFQQPASPPFPSGITLGNRFNQIATVVALLAAVGGPAYAIFVQSGASTPPVVPAPTEQPLPKRVDVNFWDSTAPVVCPANQSIKLVNHTVHVAEGAAISFEPGCKLTLVGCDIKGPLAINMGRANESGLTLIDSRIEGTNLAIQRSYTSSVAAQNSLVIGLVPSDQGQPALLHGVTAVPLTDLPGAPHVVDPAALIGQAREVSGLGDRAVLAGIDGVFVGSNGRVDFDAPAYKGKIHYRFALLPLPREEEARPAGVRLGLPVGKKADPERRLLRTVTADLDGMRLDYASSDGVTHVAADMAPHCTFKQVWDAARTGDVPSDALAHVLYNADTSGQGWWFNVENTQFTFSINASTCKR